MGLGRGQVVLFCYSSGQDGQGTLPVEWDLSVLPDGFTRGCGFEAVTSDVPTLLDLADAGQWLAAG
jgi:hypothetical protein